MTPKALITFLLGMFVGVVTLGCEDWFVNQSLVVNCGIPRVDDSSVKQMPYRVGVPIDPLKTA